MSKVIVTGGAGFIGSHLVDRLVDAGHEVLVIDNLSTGKKENLNPKAKFIEADIADYDSIKDYFSGADVVFHLAALARIQPSIKNPLPPHDANATGTLNVLWAAKNAGVGKVVYSGSSSAYGDHDPSEYPLDENAESRPTSPYAVTKMMGEQYCKLFSKLYDLPTVTLRYFNVYGERQITEGAYATVIGIFLNQRENGRAMTVIEDGAEKRRDFTHVSDVVDANILAWQSDVSGGEIFNIGYGKNFSIDEVAKIIGGEIDRIPKKPGEYLLTLADNTKARKKLGWDPKVSLEQGVDELKKSHKLD